VTGRVPPAVVVLFAALVGLTSPDSFVAWRRKALPPRKRSQSTQVLETLERFVSLARFVVAPRDASPSVPPTHKQAPPLRVQIVSARSQHRNYCSD